MTRIPCCSYFNPCDSEDFEDFKFEKLTCGQRLATRICTAISGLFTTACCCIGGLVAYRWCLVRNLTVKTLKGRTPTCIERDQSKSLRQIKVEASPDQKKEIKRSIQLLAQASASFK